MGCKAGRCNKTSTPQSIFIVTPSLEGWPTKAKKATSPHEVRLNTLDTMSQGKTQETMQPENTHFCILKATGQV